MPEVIIKLNDLNKGINILDLIAENKILSSKSEVRRIIANRGLKINNITVENEKKKLQLKDFENNTLKLSCGKKKHYLIKII